MRCGHRHVVVHRDDVEQHQINGATAEANCSCGPAILCPVCDWQILYDECFIVAPAEVVDAHLVRPPQESVN